jgi:hypothetical protein
VLTDAWLDGCEGLSTDLEKVCVGNNGNFRVSCATFIFFCLAGVAAALKPTANREAWPAKYTLYLFMVLISAFIPNEPLFASIFLNIARSKLQCVVLHRFLASLSDLSNSIRSVGGVIFIIAQQLIILDMAYNWNDSWVTKSNEADAEEAGSGKNWLRAILCACGINYVFSFGMLIYMFMEFTGCPSNNSFIAMTLILSVMVHAAQLSGDEGSLLSSSLLMAWSCFLCYSAVARNPNEACNPNLGQDETLTIILGVIVTFISLAWAGWSYTAEDKFNPDRNNTTDDKSKLPENTGKAGTEGERGNVTGVVMGDDEMEKNNDEGTLARSDGDPRKFSNSWRLNFVLASVTCWKSMVLTRWGEISGDGTIVDSSTGRISMWMIIASQWLVLSLYVWTLIAPRLFPNRDFS